MTLFWIIAVLILIFGFVVFSGAPYVPTHRSQIKKAFDSLYVLNDSDVLLDLGSGDGIVLREASARGARSIGFELNPVLVVIANLLSRRDRQVHSEVANMWRTPFPEDTTVVYVFMNGRDITKLTRRVEAEATRLQRKLFVISYGFELIDYPHSKRTSSHFLYEIQPLQIKKAQV